MPLGPGARVLDLGCGSGDFTAGLVPLVTLYGAVAAAVWFRGWRPALLAAVLGYFA